MPRRRVGKEGENTKTVRLVSLLRKEGFSDASFERLFRVVDSSGIDCLLESLILYLPMGGLML